MSYNRRASGGTSHRTRSHRIRWDWNCKTIRFSDKKKPQGFLLGVWDSFPSKSPVLEVTRGFVVVVSFQILEQFLFVQIGDLVAVEGSTLIVVRGDAPSVVGIRHAPIVRGTMTIFDFLVQLRNLIEPCFIFGSKLVALHDGIEVIGDGVGIHIGNETTTDYLSAQEEKPISF